MAKIVSNIWRPSKERRKKKKTSVGRSANSRPLNKHKRRNSKKKYRGQGL